MVLVSDSTMSDEAINFVKVWLSTIASLCYCFAIGKTIPRGFTRLLFLVPVLFLFLYLPLLLDSVHLKGPTAFFIVWLGNFKLLLFAFGNGPLSFDRSISLGSFVAVACLPIKLRRNLNENQVKLEPGKPKDESNLYFSELQSSADKKVDEEGHESLLNYAIKGLLVALLLRVYDYSEYLHPKAVLFLYSFHIYFMLDIILATAAATAKNLIGIELEPQFDKPYLATSLQKFWGRRWNLMVTSILRPTVYNPVLRFSSSYLERKWAPLPAVLTTFLVSGLMHEVMIFYLAGAWPTWEMTGFFVLHGACLTMEIALKKAWPHEKWVPPLLSQILTVGFVVSSGIWLFFPPFTNNEIDAKALKEYAAVAAFLKRIAKFVAHNVSNYIFQTN